MVSRNRIRCLSGLALAAAFAAAAAAQPPAEGNRLVEALRLRADGRFAEAREILVDLRRRVERELPESNALAQVLDCEGLTEQALGHFVEAESLLRRAVSIAAKDTDGSLAAIRKLHLAELYVEERRWPDVEPLVRQVIASASGLPLAQSLEDLGVVRAWGGKYKEAEQLFRKAVDQLESVLGPRDPLLSGALLPLAIVLTLEHRASEAVEVAERGWRVVETASPAVGRPDLASTMQALAGVYARAGLVRQAEPYARRSLAIAEEVYGPAKPMLASYLKNCSDILKKAGNNREAKAMEQRARAILAQNAHDNPTKLTVSVNALR